MRSDTVSVFTIDGATRLVQDMKELLLAQLPLLAVLYLRTPLSRASVRRTVVEYLRCTYQQPLPSFFLKEPDL